MWKFCGKAQFPHSFGNCVFPQNVHTRKLGEITVFFAVYVFPCHLVQYTNFLVKRSNFRYLIGFWICFWMQYQDLTDPASVCYCENQVFLVVLPIIRNQSKIKRIFKTFINNNLRYKTQFHDGFFYYQR